MTPEIRNYFAEIGTRGGRAGKGSPARAAAAKKANAIRWEGHTKKDHTPKPKPKP
jgi:hypothetical protein